MSDADANDRSNGYDALSDDFALRRSPFVGVTEVRAWAESLPRGAAVLDLACGTGVPITATLIDAGCDVYAVDASPAMVAAFRARFPDVPVACETAEASRFFDREFDAAISWGLMFLLSAETQALVIQRVARALRPGGSFLFTSPAQPITWSDAMTDRASQSLGADTYRALLAASSLPVVREFDDEGDNHYYVSIRT